MPLENAVQQRGYRDPGRAAFVYRDLEIPAEKLVVDLWNFVPARSTGVSDRLSSTASSAHENSRHRRGRIYLWLSDRRSCSTPDTKSLASTTSASTAGSRSATTRIPRYRFVEGDAKDTELLKELLEDCDHFVAAAAHDRRHLLLS